jgi:alkylation response protein AidB-like acyl-CoA dehydrogenase
MDDATYTTYREDLFARLWDEVAPMEEEIEESETIPRDRLFPILADTGVFGLLIPEEYGGRGLTITQYLPIIAEFAKIHGGIRALVHVHNSMAHAYEDLASEEQCRAVLPDAAAGRGSVAFALTEPQHGTGKDIGTTAVRDGDDYVIDGEKWLITNSDFASHFILFARTGDAVSAFSLERETPGFSIEPLPETMGCKGGEHGRLTLEQVRLPASALLGEEGTGLAGMERSLEISRVLVAGSSLGTAERAFELSLEHARQRVTFGKPIGDRQAVQRYLAEMAQDIYALKLMLRDVAARWDRGERIPAEASLVKLFGLEAVGRVTDRALLVHGGVGYTRARSIERLYRDARLNWLEEGTPTIQYSVAARQFLGGHQLGDA